jgi:ribonuclease T2
VGGAESFQCTDETGARFVLHGLWPDGVGKSWPQWCAAAPVLPARTIAAHYCATPSAQLLQHEWAKHGTCMPGETPESYFAQSNRLFHGLRFPDMAALARPGLTEGAFAEAFAAGNPGLAAEDIRLNLDKQGWLQEVWLCLDTSFRPMRCAAPAQPSRTVRIRLS